MSKLKLSDEERALVRRLPDKIGYVAIVDFHRGPRGAQFRGIRSKVYATMERAERENDKSQWQARYRTPVREVRVVLVDPLGNVVQ